MKTQIETRTPHVPGYLLKPVSIEAVTETIPALAAAQGATNAVLAVDKANGQIKTIDCILDAAKRGLQAEAICVSGGM